MKPLQRDSWREAWELALGLTVEELRQADLQKLCEQTGAIYRADDIEISFLDQTYRICPPDFNVTLADAEIPITEKILILHYFNTARAMSPSAKWIGFVEVPGGELYLPNFRARSVDRLVRAFTNREDALIEAAADLGGAPSDYGDVSVEIRAFPNVPLLLTLWRGDDEFPASGDILFDATVSDYLSTEDMVVLASMVVGRLCK